MTVAAPAGWPRTGVLVVCGWLFTQHGLERCREMALDLEEVVRVLESPTKSYPSPTWCGRGRAIAADGYLAVVHNPADRVVITVLWDGKEARTVSA